MPTRTGGRLFKCNCCKSTFSKPTNPAWGFLKGLACWFGAFFVLATFMNLKNEKHSEGIFIKDVYVNFNTLKDIQTEIDTFLTSNGLSTEKLIKVYHSNVTELNQSNYINYLPFTGLNYSASALACHFAQDELKNLESGSILIVNNLCSGNLGLTLIQK